MDDKLKIKSLEERLEKVLLMVKCAEIEGRKCVPIKQIRDDVFPNPHLMQTVR